MMSEVVRKEIFLNAPQPEQQFHKASSSGSNRRTISEGLLLFDQFVSTSFVDSDFISTINHRWIGHKLASLRGTITTAVLAKFLLGSEGRHH